MAISVELLAKIRHYAAAGDEICRLLMSTLGPPEIIEATGDPGVISIDTDVTLYRAPEDPGGAVSYSIPPGVYQGQTKVISMLSNPTDRELWITGLWEGQTGILVAALDSITLVWTSEGWIAVSVTGNATLG